MTDFHVALQELCNKTASTMSAVEQYNMYQPT